MLCMNFLLNFLQAKVRSPHLSCFCPHLQKRDSSSANRGKRNFCLSAIVVDQLSSLCVAMLLHIPTKGYDVYGERILGMR